MTTEQAGPTGPGEATPEAALEAVLVGPGTRDDAGVYRLGDHALVATADFIPPVCDDPRRYGRVAAANALSDVYAMGGRPLFALNLCCFPGGVPDGVLPEILAGGAAAIADAGAALLGGHSVTDPELKYGLAVVGEADPGRLLTNAGATPGQRLVLTKPLGTGVMINAFKAGKLDEAGLEPAMVEMERLNADAARLALDHRVTAATDVTGFGLAGHALNIARNSALRLEICFADLPIHDAFMELVDRGVTTGCTAANRDDAIPLVDDRHGLTAAQRELLFDPQTSGALLLTVPEERTGALLAALAETGHTAADVGRTVAGSPGITVI